MSAAWIGNVFPRESKAEERIDFLENRFLSPKSLEALCKVRGPAAGAARPVLASGHYLTGMKGKGWRQAASCGEGSCERGWAAFTG